MLRGLHEIHKGREQGISDKELQLMRQENENPLI